MPTITGYVLALLLVAHGWVHLVFVASTRGWFGGNAEWAWDGRSRLLGGLVGVDRLVDLVSAGLLLAALGFVGGAVGYVVGSGPWATALAGAAVLSAILFVAMWDGTRADLLEQGALGVLVDLAVFGWVAIVG